MLSFISIMIFHHKKWQVICVSIFCPFCNTYSFWCHCLAKHGEALILSILEPLYKNWTYVVQNIRSFFKLGTSRFKVDVPSATQCPFCNTILDCHVLSVQNAIIPSVTSSNCYFFDYLIFSIK